MAFKNISISKLCSILTRGQERSEDILCINSGLIFKVCEKGRSFRGMYGKPIVAIFNSIKIQLISV